jgi:hypothetical protein
VEAAATIVASYDDNSISIDVVCCDDDGSASRGSGDDGGEVGW